MPIVTFPIVALGLGLSAAVLRASTFVVNTADDEFDTPSGPRLSLREALRDAAATDGPDTLVLAAPLDGMTLEPLGPSQGSALVVADPGGVTIDASALPHGLGIRGGARGFRIFAVGSGTSLTLIGIRLLRGGGDSFAASGGAIFNGGTVHLSGCTLAENSTGPGGAGGAIMNFGALSLTDCALVGNRVLGNGALAGGAGGAIANAFDGRSSLVRCTLYGNSASGGQPNSAGGAIANSGTLSLLHCTLSGNYSGGGFTGGGGIMNAGTAALGYCILAGNAAASGSGDDLLNRGILEFKGVNIARSAFHSGDAWVSGPPALVTDPLLAPLDGYGGPTPTLALRPGSPARDAADGSTASADQRGFPLHGPPDLGAYEAGTWDNFPSWIWERLPASATPEEHSPIADYDGDGVGNAQEFSAGTNPSVPDAPLRFTDVTLNADGTLSLRFPTVTGADYAVQRSDNLTGGWTDAGLAPVAGNGATVTVSVRPSAERPQGFYRLEARP